MTRFLQPEWFWLLALLPLVLLWRGRRGPVAAIEYSDVSLAREVAREPRQLAKLPRRERPASGAGDRKSVV